MKAEIENQVEILIKQLFKIDGADNLVNAASLAADALLLFLDLSTEAEPV